LKKTVIILYLLLIGFYSGGYKLLVSFLQEKTKQELQSLINADDYNNHSVIELSVPIDLPYLTDWQAWESTQGIIIIDEIPYQYVERILKNGEMIYRCLPNHNMQMVFSARDRFEKLSNQFQDPLANKNQPLTIKITPLSIEAICLQIGLAFHTNSPIIRVNLCNPYDQKLPAYYKNVPTPPPNGVRC